MRIDRLQTEMPPPSDPDPAGAAVVQELLGGKFGEMSTFMNYTFQSFNFRNRQGARPFYDLVANIAAEEFGHIELVSTAINTMLTGAGEKGSLPKPSELLNPQHFAAGGAGTLVQDSNGKPWNGDYVTSTGDLVEDLVHNFFLETGARNGKLKVYEMVDHPAARALTGYLLVRGGVHQVAYARAVENLTGADLSKLFPAPRIPTEKIPECQPHIERGEHTKLYRFSPERLPRAGRGLERHPPRDRRRPRRRRRPAGGLRAVRPAVAGGRLRPGLRAGGDRRDRRQAAQGRRPVRRADRRRGQRHQRRRGQDQGSRLLVATLTKLESKLAEVLGLAMAAQDAAREVRGMLGSEHKPLAEKLAQARDDARETQKRCTELASSFKGKKTAILDEAREVKQEATEMREAYLADEEEPLDGFEFLTMAEAGEVGHWSIVAKLNEKAGNAELRTLTDWALPIQQRHLQEVLDGSLKLAADEDPDADA